LLIFFLLELNIHYGHLTLDKTSQSEIVVVVEDHGVMVSSAYNWKIIYSILKTRSTETEYTVFSRQM